MDLDLAVRDRGLVELDPARRAAARGGLRGERRAQERGRRGGRRGGPGLAHRRRGRRAPGHPADEGWREGHARAHRAQRHPDRLHREGQPLPLGARPGGAAHRGGPRLRRAHHLSRVHPGQRHRHRGRRQGQPRRLVPRPHQGRGHRAAVREGPRLPAAGGGDRGHRGQHPRQELRDRGGRRLPGAAPHDLGAVRDLLPRHRPEGGLRPPHPEDGRHHREAGRRPPGPLRHLEPAPRDHLEGPLREGLVRGLQPSPSTPGRARAAPTTSRPSSAWCPSSSAPSRAPLYALLFAIPLAVMGALYTSQFMHPTHQGQGEAHGRDHGRAARAWWWASSPACGWPRGSRSRSSPCS